MRKYFILSSILAASVLFISCNNKTTTSAAATDNEAEKATDTPAAEINIQRKLVPIAFDFSNICSLCGINIEYTQGDKCQIELEGDSVAWADITIHNFGDSRVKLRLLYERGDWFVDDFYFYYKDEGVIKELREKEGMKEYISANRKK